MADHVRQALSAPHHLAIEAGTGVGKSLAYLVPAARWSASTHKRVAVSTYTRVLQSQLIGQDVELMKKLVPEAPKVAVAYGQENYLCRFRLASRVSRGLFDTREEAAAADRLLDWAETTEDGILLNLREPISPGLARRVSRDSATCRRQRCTFFKDCFYFRARRAWAESGILVTNHALFFAGLGEESDLLPEIDAVVFDEAHRVEDACVRHFGVQVSQYQLHLLLNSLKPDKGRGLLHALPHDSETRSSIEQVVLECRSELAEFFDRTASLLPTDSSRQRLTEPLPAVPASPVSRLADAVKEVAQDADDEHLAAELAGSARRLADAAAGLEAFHEPDDSGHVRWVESTGQRSVSLISAPLDVAPLLRQNVHQRFASVVYTSATLTVAGRFDFLSSRLGLDGFETVSLDSPFDFARNSLVYIPSRLSPPTSTEFATEAANVISDIVHAAQGRALVLFTSYDMLRRVAELVDFGPHPVLQQGELPVPALLAQFREDTHSVLLATQSFWQGIDVPGESLSCLVIARLPFEVPDDPRLSAIAERLQAEGIHPFPAYQLPNAVLRFRQGFGRLIRTQTDRGVVCVLDRRIQIRRYGRVFLDSLPPGIRQTTDLAEVARHLAQKTRTL